MVQEYGRYFGLKTACFRGGCLTGPGHSGAELHGFLSYLVKCASRAGPTRCSATRASRSATTFTPTIWCNAFWHFFTGAARRARSTTWAAARPRTARCSKRIAIVERLTGRPMQWTYSDINRAGDHIWWVSDIRKFASHYPGLGR